MNLWKTLGLVVVFGLLLAYTLKFERGEKPDPEADRTVVELLGFKAAADITEVTVEAGGKGFTLVREDAPADSSEDTTGSAKPEPVWKISKPISAKADSAAVKSYVDTLLTTKATQRYRAEDVKDVTDQSIGLDAPAGKLILKDKHGRTATLTFGAVTPNDSGYYARAEGDAGMLIFSKYFFESNLRDKKLGDLRDKDLLQFATSDAKTLTLQYPADTIKLEKRGDDWILLGAKELKADATTVNSLLSTLATSRVEEFVESPGQPSFYGLDSPRIRVVVGLGAKGENGLLIGAEAPSDEPEPAGEYGQPPSTTPKVYVQRQGDSEVLIAAGSLYDACLKDRRDLRDKTVLAFKSEEVTKIAYSLDGREVLLEKTQPDKSKDERPVWQLRKPVDLLADQKKVDSLLSTFDLLRATAFVDDPTDLKPYGLVQPRGRIELTTGSKTLPALLLGKAAADGTGMYVKLADQNVVLKVRTSFADDLILEPNRLRDLLVVKFDRTEVKEISLRQKNGDLCVVTAKGANEWEVTKPEKLKADSGRVGAVLTALEELRGDEWVTDQVKDLKPYGLDQPDVTATVTMRDGKQHIVIVAQDPKGGLGAYLKAQGKDVIYRSDNGLILTDLKKGPEDFKPFEQPPEMPGMEF